MKSENWYTFPSSISVLRPIQLLLYTSIAVYCRAIHKSHCFHKRGHEAPCKFSNNPYMIALGIFEILLSQIQNFHELSWLSGAAAIMPFGYASIGIGLSFARVISGNVHSFSSFLFSFGTVIDKFHTSKNIYRQVFLFNWAHITVVVFIYLFFFSFYRIW